MIEDNEIFKNVPKSTIDKLISGLNPKLISKGQSLFLEKEKPKHVYLIIKGVFSFNFHTESGDSYVISFAPTNTFIGELEVFNDSPRISEARALVDSEVLCIPTETFKESFLSDQRISTALIKRYASELEYFMRFSLVLNHDKRLALVLIQLAKSFGIKAANEIKISIPLSQEILAKMVGKPRQHINTTLKSWERKNWIKINFMGIVIVDINSLKNYAESIA